MTAAKEQSQSLPLDTPPHTFSKIFSGNVKGAAWKLLSCATFAAMNGLVRYLAGGSDFSPENPLPTNVIMFFQNAIGALIILLPWFLKAQFLNPQRETPRSIFQFSFPRHPFLHLMRVVSCVMGVSLFYLSLKYLPIAEAVALTFIGPVISVIGAKFWLGEKLNFQRILAILLSLAGAYIIARPDTVLFADNSHLHFAFLLPLGSTIAFAWDKLLTRKLTQVGEKAETLATYLLFLMTPVSLIPAIFEWTTPSLNLLPWILLLGCLATIAQFSFAKSYQYAEVSFLTPFSLSKFLFSALAGILIFAEIPANAVWVGISIIAVSTLLLPTKKTSR